MSTDPVLDALEQALWARSATQGVIHHSDHCGQYLSIRYTERLAEAGAEPSAGSVGDCCDNALAETAIGLHQTEIVHQRDPWRHFDAVEYATLECLTQTNRSPENPGRFIERWLVILSQRQIKRGSHRSTRERESAIRHFLDVRNQDPKPSEWHKTADELIDSVGRRCMRTIASVNLLDFPSCTNQRKQASSMARCSESTLPMVEHPDLAQRLQNVRQVLGRGRVEVQALDAHRATTTGKR